MTTSEITIEYEILMEKFQNDYLGSHRIRKETAKDMLLNDKSMIIDGHVIKWFEIVDIGLGVCEVKLAPPNGKGTRLVKKFS